MIWYTKMDDIKVRAKDLLPKVMALLDELDDLRGDAEIYADDLRGNLDDEPTEDYLEMDEASTILQEAYECMDSAYDELANVARSK